ncbi:MAG: hypothetical protein ACTSRA_03945 [Promethearchaeota archaeon]
MVDNDLKMIKKCIFIGPPEAGKTSLRRFFFEGIPAEDLINKSEKPTIGLKYFNYEYLYSLPASKKTNHQPEKIPIALTIVDSAGQSLTDWLDDKKERVFPGADIIFYVFDVSDWLDKNKKAVVQDNIMQIYERRLELAPESYFYIIAHKFDKIPQGKPFRNQMKRRIKQEMNEYVFDKMTKYLDFDIYITSLYEEYATDTFITLVNLLTDLAKL